MERHDEGGASTVLLMCHLLHMAWGGGLFGVGSSWRCVLLAPCASGSVCCRAGVGAGRVQLISGRSGVERRLAGCNGIKAMPNGGHSGAQGFNDGEATELQPHS